LAKRFDQRTRARLSRLDELAHSHVARMVTANACGLHGNAEALGRHVASLKAIIDAAPASVYNIQAAVAATPTVGLHEAAGMRGSVTSGLNAQGRAI